MPREIRNPHAPILRTKCKPNPTPSNAIIKGKERKELRERTNGKDLDRRKRPPGSHPALTKHQSSIPPQAHTKQPHCYHPEKQLHMPWSP